MCGGRDRSLFFPYESEVPIKFISISVPRQFIYKKPHLSHVRTSFFCVVASEKEPKKGSLEKEEAIKV